MRYLAFLQRKAFVVLLFCALFALRAALVYAQSSAVGQWSAVQTLPFEPVHSMLLPNGKVLWFSDFADSLNPQIWDPATGTNTPSQLPGYEVFCGGHSFLANGQVLVSGGNIAIDVGLPNASIYDPIQNTWTALPNMNAGRWYPTSTTLATGDVLVTGGDISQGNVDTLPQIWQVSTQSWVDLTGAIVGLQLYPRMFVAPNSQVFLAGPGQTARYLNSSGTGSWTTVANLHNGNRSYSSSVMYDTGKVIIIGGGDPPVATTETIDLGAQTPSWSYAAPMANARRNLNATLLPDGRILATGGSNAAGFDTKSGAIFTAEVWDPVMGTWTTWAGNTLFRGYHSTALLLPDGRIFSAGGTYGGKTYEVFSPPYLFNGPQPTVTSVPGVVNYGQSFFIATPNAAAIAQVNLIALGAATHAFNMGQRISKLAFTRSSGGLTATAPSGGNLAPPGYYMLFLVNSSGVPSVAPIIQLGTSPNVAAAPSALNFNSQLVGITSATQAVTLSVANSGSSTALNFGGISITGTNSSDFTQSGSTCGVTLAVGASCSISVSFTPSAIGARNAALTVSDNGTGSPRTIGLNGTGTVAMVPLVTLSAGSFTFPAQQVGITSTSQTVLLTNTGNATLNISSISATGDFAQNNTCGSSLAPNASCTIALTFTPAAVGPRGGTLSLTDNAPGSSQAVSLSGTGASNPVPVINLPLVPGSAASGGSGFTLTVNGTGFASNAVVNWNGSPRATSFVRTSQLAATITASDIATAGTALITVFSPAPGGGASNPAFLSVSAPTPSVALSRTDFATGNLPQAVTARDFNGDGRPDLAVANGSDNTVSILLGNGDGTFKPQTVIPVPGGPLALIAADFNGDGRLDLAVVDQRLGLVSILLGNGDGTFQAHVDYAVGNNPSDVVAADFNGDGHLDLAVSNSADNTVSILAGNGDGTFQAQHVYGTAADPLALVAGDFNGDGKLDLALASNNLSAVSVLLGNGDGTFVPHLEYSTALLPNSVVAADFNGDGRLDLAVGNASNSVSVLLGNGDGTFPTHIEYTVAANPQAIIAVDLNGDGQLDLAVANFGSNTISVLPGNGDGTFQAHADYPAGVGAGALAAADFNADGRMDLAVANQTDDTVSAFLQSAVVQLSAINLNFGNQGVGITSAPLPVTVTNTGSALLQFNGLAITGTNPADFSSTSTCGSSLAASASCAINVTFTPASSGTRTASLNVSGSPASISLTGVGVVSGVILTPNTVTFGPQQVGTTSSIQVFTLANNSNSVLSVTGSGITGANSGDFAQTSTCGASLAAGANCAITMTFSPAAAGTRSAILSVADSDPGSPQNAALAGTGVAPSVSLSSGSLAFGNQAVGVASAPQAVTLTNSGSAILNISGLSVTGPNSSDFAVTNTCGPSLAVGANCAITAIFTPAATGARSGVITITDNTVGNPQSIVLSGTGVAPSVSLSPAALSFPSQLLGVSSVPQTITLTNSGTAPLQLTGTTISGGNGGDFAQSNACGSTLAAGANCSISVTFTPTAIGPRGAALSVADNAVGSPQSVSLSGTGLAPVVALSPGSLTFAGQLVGTASPAQSLTLANSGTATLNLAAIAASGDFTQTNTCSSTLAAGASCSISIAFVPAAQGSRAGTISFTDSAVGSPQMAALSGTGLAPVVALSPTSLAFGSLQVGATSAPRTVTVTNSGTAALSIAGIAITGPNASTFAQTNTCGSSVAAGAQCSINVTFTPAAVGSASATLGITDNANNSPQSVSLTGNGTTVVLTPLKVSFVRQKVGSTSSPQSITLRNIGTNTLSITSIAITGTNIGDFAQANTCGSSLVVSAACSITVTFTPQAAGNRSAALTVSDTAAGSPQQKVTLAGTGF